MPVNHSDVAARKYSWIAHDKSVAYIAMLPTGLCVYEVFQHSACDHPCKLYIYIYIYVCVCVCVFVCVVYIFTFLYG